MITTVIFNNESLMMFWNEEFKVKKTYLETAICFESEPLSRCCGGFSEPPGSCSSPSSVLESVDPTPTKSSYTILSFVCVLKLMIIALHKLFMCLNNLYMIWSVWMAGLWESLQDGIMGWGFVWLKVELVFWMSKGYKDFCFFSSLFSL